MKITIKTLQQKTFEVDAEPQHTVLNLKEKVGSVQGEPPDNLKLFYSGRTLSDDNKSIESLNLKEGTYLVVMVIKRRTNESDLASSLPTFSRPESTGPTPPFNPGSSASFTPSAPFGTTGFGGPSMSFDGDSSSMPFGGSASLGGSSMPFGNSSRPFGDSSASFGASRPFSGSSDMFGGASRPFGSSSDLFSGTSRPFGGSPDQFGGSSRPFGGSSTSFNAPSHNAVPKPTTASEPSGFDNNKWMSGTSMFGASDKSLEDSVKNLVDMGFERDQVLKALKASFGNTERAVEYLTTGIPDEDDDEDSGPSGFRPFGVSPMPSSFMRPQPTEMVGHIEEVDPDAPEEPTKPAEPEAAPPSPVTAPVEDLKLAESVASATISTPTATAEPKAEPETAPTPEVAPAPEVAPTPEVAPAPEPAPVPVSEPEPTPAPLSTPPKDTPVDASSGKSVSPTPPSPTLPSAPVPPSMPDFSSMGSRPTPFASSSSSMPSESDFSTLSGFGGFGGFGGLGGLGSSGGGVTLESLRNDPVVQQFRQLAGQNPELMGPLLEQLVQSKPGLMQLIASNPEAVARIFASGGGGSDSRVEAKSHCISVTGEEKEAIERIESMGFQKSDVIQAYFAFDKNEVAAVNYLIENED